MATVKDSISDEIPTEKKRQPLGRLRFDWAVIILSFWLLGGLYLDGWAHNHIQSLETFFTPWHAVFYSGFFVVAAFLVFTLIRNRVKGYPWLQAVPPGYELSLFGVFVFAIGGVLDMIWHILFGIEVSTEALLSPTHLMLALGILLIVSGPLRAAWLRLPKNTTHGWVKLFPMLLSLTFILSLLTFMTQYAHPFVNVWASKAESGSEQGLGVASILLQSAILMGLLLLIIRRWTLPPGAFTLIFTVSTILITFMHDQYLLIAAGVVAGIVADLLFWQLKPSTTQPAMLRLFAFVVLLVFYGLYFLDLLLTNGLVWSIHLWMGSAALAGVVGLLLSYLLVPPLTSTEPS